MRVFVTGATGFVGSAIVNELLENGHQVLGLARSQEGAERLRSIGAEVLQGDVNDPDTLKQGIISSDAVVHTAFNHNMTQYKANCESDRLVIETMGQLLAGSQKPLIVTSGIAVVKHEGLLKEDDPLSASSGKVPRAATEEAAAVIATQGVNVYIVRLPPTVHGKGDHGFVPVFIAIAREKGESAYLDEGKNLWPTVHRLDAAVLYRLILEQRPQLKVFHAVGEQGVAFKDIAEAVGQGLNLPVVSKTGEDATSYFGWFRHFAGLHCAASSEKTETTLGWKAKGPDLLTDIATAGYLYNSN